MNRTPPAVYPPPSPSAMAAGRGAEAVSGRAPRAALHGRPCTFPRQDAIQALGGVTLAKALFISREQRRKNYLHNLAQGLPAEALTPEGLIVAQHRLGALYINHCTVCYAGCSAIALYNVIHLLNPRSQVTFPQAVSWMEPYGVLNNALGALPMGVSRSLRGLGYQVRCCFAPRPRRAAELAARADAAVVLYMTLKGFHYVAFQAVPGAGTDTAPEFMFYNDGPAGAERKTYEAFWHSGRAGKFSSLLLLVRRPEN